MKKTLLGLALSIATTLLFAATPPKGTLIIVGGGGETPEIAEAFLQGSGGRGGVVGIITTPTSEPEENLKYWKEKLARAGIEMVPLDVRKREDSLRPDLLEAARRCTGFWFTGGDQNRVGDQIVGTSLHQVVRERYEAGAAVGGTSAGAAIMSKVMLTGDDRNGKEALSEFGPGAYKTREGMGFLPAGVVVDQHFLRRGRENRLFSVIMDHPDYLGLGIDEATALVVKDGKAKVLGKRSVMVFDPAGMTLNGNAFQNLRIHVLSAGQAIDLATRKVSQ
jgi:cyanophycinase